MAFQFPDRIRKDEDLSNLAESGLKYWHEKMHVIWNQIELGTVIPEWNLEDVYYIHKDLINKMKEKKIAHLVPISTLDVIKEE